MAGRIAVVDEHNRFVRWEARRTIHEQRLVHRSVHVLLWDAQGRLLVQRRHADKQTYPRHWDVSCAGHVEESDYVRGPDDELDAVYAAVAARELEEELGVVVLRTADAVLRAPAEPGLAAPLRLLDRIAPEPGVHYEQLHLFEARSDGPFVLQAEEVEEHRLLTRAETDALLAGPEPVTHALRWLLARGYWPAS